jgi:hypothetical protein
MQNLNFKTWIFNEIADFGFGGETSSKVQGGTVPMKGDGIFSSIDSSRILRELVALTALGPFAARRTWEDTVEYGDGHGSIKINITPLGSERFVVRQMIHDLKGEEAYICHHVIPLDDYEDQDRETEIANILYDKIKELRKKEIYGPVSDYEKFRDLAMDLWSRAKINHPSYCMFPVSFRKMDDHYYKAVFEFRGNGVYSQNNKPSGRCEQFHLDIYWDKDRGLIRSWGYPIDSSLGRHAWGIQPSEWDEYFSPNQDKKVIIDSIIKSFMQF